MERLTPPRLGVAALLVLTLAAAPAPIPPPSTYPVAATIRDGRKDFDFEFGTWRTHFRILKHPLTADHAWKDCYGTSIVRPFWNGSANLEDGDLQCPNRYIGGMTFRFYDAQTHQWTLWWGTRALGVSPPQLTGHFGANGVGNFYAYDSWQGKPIVCRFRWTTVNGNPRFEQAFSVDRGRSWETNWTTDYSRVSPQTKGTWNAVDSRSDGHNGFDFLIGTWKTHYMRLRHPLSHDPEWYACNGSSVVRPFWSGSANMETGDVRCPARTIQGVTVRLYHAPTHRWLLYWGTQKNGLAAGLPQIGKFDAAGVGEFFAPDTYAGKPIVVRYKWELRNGNPHFEQAFSLDKGKTWETNWTTDYERTGL